MLSRTKARGAYRSATSDTLSNTAFMVATVTVKA